MFDFDMFMPGDEMVGLALGFYLVYALVVGGIGLLFYILQSVSYYTIAKRRGIKHPGLSWVPVCNMWMLGCISDQYRYVAKGQVKGKRKALLVLNILSAVLTVAMYVLFAGFIITALRMNPDGFMSDSDMLGFVGSFAGMMIISLILIGISIANMVIQYIALYDLYTSCDPGNSVLYLLLSIFIGLTPVWLMICRNKDGGMPPRKTAAPQPSAPALNTAAEPWDNAASDAEPWDSTNTEAE